MAVIQLNYVSNALQRTVPVQVILPVDKLTPDGKLPAPKKFKTLYLLHGYLGNYTDWLSGTRIQRWAEERDLAVVMPSGDNSFYVDRPATGNCYGKFISQELVEVTRRMFPLSHRREDTYIGGLSMGGYGALRNGLANPKTFGAVISLSGASPIFGDPKMLEKQPQDADAIAFGTAVFGPMPQALYSEHNLWVLIQKLAKKLPASRWPRLYIACGTEDGLLPVNRLLHDCLEKNGILVTYREAPGNHNWDFWDDQIKQVIDWLPLDECSQGINSGNVHT